MRATNAEFWPAKSVAVVLGATLAVAIGAAGPAMADGRKVSNWTITAGGGGIYAPDYEGSKRYRFRPLPYLGADYKGGMIEFRGTQLLVPVLRLGKGRFKAGISTELGMGREEKDNRIALKGLGDIGPSVEVGGFASMDFGAFTLNLNGGQDVAGGHKGYLVRASLIKTIPLTTSLAMNLSVDSAWASRKYMNRFFGITATQSSASGLPVYAASAAFKDVGGNVGLAYSLNRHWGINGGARYSRLLGDAADNPLVRTRGSKDQVTSYLFLAYSF